MCLTSVLSGKRALQTKMRRKKSTNFPEPGASPKPRGLSLHFPPPPSPLSMSSIPPSVFKEKSTDGESGGQGWLEQGGHVCVYYTPVSAGRQIGDVFPRLSEERPSHRRAQTS